MAWPPYLMTTVVPENSWMYGSASASTRGLHHCFTRCAGIPRPRPLAPLVTTCPCSRRRSAWVRSVKVTVASPVPACRSQSIAISLRQHQLRQRGSSCGAAMPSRHTCTPWYDDVDALGVEARAARTELGEHAPPVRVVAVQRALHQLAARHRPSSACAPRPRNARRARRWWRAWSRPPRRPPSGARDRRTPPRARRRTPRRRGSSG